MLPLNEKFPYVCVCLEDLGARASGNPGQGFGEINP